MPARQHDILLTGGTGLIGNALASRLMAAGHTLRKMVRSRSQLGSNGVLWDFSGPLSGDATNAIAVADTIIHLAGEPIAAGRWTAERKRRLLASRVNSTRALAEQIAIAARTSPRKMTFLVASGVGFYGDRGEELLNENSLPGTGFLAELAQAWEAAAQPAVEAGARVIHLRLGMVLSRSGGALPMMLPAFRAGLGAKLGKGHQWLSWISLEDVVHAVEFLLADESLEGPVNLVAPAPTTNAEFTSTLASALHRPALLAAPAHLLRLIFGEMADEAMLASTRAVPSRLQQAGFSFAHPDLRDALQAELMRE